MAYPPNDPLSNGATSTDYNKLRLEYDYDSFGNVKTLREANNGASPPATFTFSYDAHNRLTQAFGQSYSYDSAGRITSYEGVSHGYAAAPGHGVNTVGGADRFDYDANGNVTLRNKGLSTQQTLTWSHENRLASLTATGINESYLYDDAGIRVKKVSGSTTTYYPFPHYEVSGSTVTKYYFFNGQRVAMKVGSTLTYLHPDHLGSTAQATDSSGGIVANQGYRGYGKYRLGGALPTVHEVGAKRHHRYTGQKLDTDTALMYYGARYYDRHIGTFISPDTLVPDPTNIWDYNRFAYARLNPLKYNDPTGHCAEPLTFVLCLGTAGGVSNAIGNWGGQVIKNLAVSGDSLTESVRNVRYGEVGIAFGAGFVSGASAPFMGGIGGAIAVNAAIGAGQSAVTQVVVDGKELHEINVGDVAVNTVLGGAAGLIQGNLLTHIASTEVTEGGLYGSSKVLTGLGVSADPYVKAVAPESAEVFEQMVRHAQLASTGTSRTVAGVATANAPVPSMSCSRLFGCAGEAASWTWTSIFSELHSDNK